MNSEDRIKLLENALKPFAAIADEYDASGLDECRPEWVIRGQEKLDLGKELYSGRGGKELMTLGHVLNARAALQGKPLQLPAVDPRIGVIKAMYEASLPNLAWEEMSEERRDAIIANYEKLGYP